MNGRVIKVVIETGFSGATHEDEYPLPAGWDDLTEEQQSIKLEEFADDSVANHIEISAWVENR